MGSKDFWTLGPLGISRVDPIHKRLDNDNMAFILEILSGPRKGTKVPLRQGLKIGRKVGDLLIDDAKISGKHAHIEKNAKGEWTIVDDGSSNGIRIEGRRVPTPCIAS